MITFHVVEIAVLELPKESDDILSQWWREEELIVSAHQLDIVTVYGDNSVKRNSSNERRHTIKVIHSIIIVNISVVCGLMIAVLSIDHVMIIQYGWVA